MIGKKEIKRTEKLSTKNINNLSKEIGNNPFEAIQQMFKEVPLVNIDTKDLNIKIPSLTSEDINKYISYLTLWIEKNGKTLEDWTSVINEILAMCGTTDKKEAADTKKKLETEKAALNGTGT